MFCKYCGKEVPAGAAFCVYCGKKQDVPAPAAETQPVILEERPAVQEPVQEIPAQVPYADPYGPYVQPEMPQKKKNNLPVILAAVGGGLALVLVLIVLLVKFVLPMLGIQHRLSGGEVYSSDIYDAAEENGTDVWEIPEDSEEAAVQEEEAITIEEYIQQVVVPAYREKYEAIVYEPDDTIPDYHEYEDADEPDTDDWDDDLDDEADWDSDDREEPFFPDVFIEEDMDYQYYVCFADVTHDGIPDMIVLMLDAYNDGIVQVYTEADGETRKIFQSRGSTFHVGGFNDVYLYYEDGEAYLVYDSDAMWQGVGEQICAVFYLDEYGSRYPLTACELESDDGMVDEVEYNEFASFRNWYVDQSYAIYAGSRGYWMEQTAEEAFAGLEMSGTPDESWEPLAILPGETVEIDLDGDGSTELCGLEAVLRDDEYYSRYTLTVNGQAVTELEGFYASLRVVDIDVTDGQKELVFFTTLDSGTLDAYEIYTMRDGAAVRAANVKDIPVMQGLGHLSRMSTDDFPGNGTFCIYADTPIYVSSFGCMYVQIPYVYDGVSVTAVEQEQYAVSYYEGITYKGFAAIGDYTVYTEPGGSEAAFTMPRGEIGIPQAVAIRNGKVWLQVSWGLESDDVGWIEGSDEMYTYFCQPEGWG